MNNQDVLGFLPTDVESIIAGYTGLNSKELEPVSDSLAKAQAKTEKQLETFFKTGSFSKLPSLEETTYLNTLKYFYLKQGETFPSHTKIQVAIRSTISILANANPKADPELVQSAMMNPPTTLSELKSLISSLSTFNLEKEVSLYEDFFKFLTPVSTDAENFLKSISSLSGEKKLAEMKKFLCTHIIERSAALKAIKECGFIPTEVALLDEFKADRESIFLLAAKTGHVSNLKALWETIPETNQFALANAAFHVAVLNGQVVSLEFLKDKIARNELASVGESAWIDAVIQQQYGVLHFLRNTSSIWNEIPWSAVQSTCEWSQNVKEVLNICINHPNISSKDLDRLFSFPQLRSNPETFSMIVEHPLFPQTKVIEKALLLAVEHNSKECLELLLPIAVARLKTTTYYYYKDAYEYEYYKIYGPSDKTSGIACLRIAIQLAAQNGCTECLKLLMDVSKNDLDHYLRNTHPDFLSASFKQAPLFSYNPEHSGFFSASFGDAIQAAAQNDRPECLNVLLQIGAGCIQGVPQNDLHAAFDFALDHAKKTGNKECLKLLGANSLVFDRLSWWKQMQYRKWGK